MWLGTVDVADMELRGEAAAQGVKRLGMATLGPAVTLSMSRSALRVLGVELWVSCTLSALSLSNVPSVLSTFRSETGFAKLLKLA